MKLRAFDLGVDDILAIPFSPEELLARSIVITRRSSAEGSADRVDNQAWRDGDRHPPPRGPHRELGGPLRQHRAEPVVRAREPGGRTSREEILDGVWGPDFLAESNIVDRHIRSLRIKLQNDYRRPRFIATVPGKGYRSSRPSRTRAGAGRTRRVGRPIARAGLAPGTPVASSSGRDRPARLHADDRAGAPRQPRPRRRRDAASRRPARPRADRNRGRRDHRHVHRLPPRRRG